VCEMRGFGGRRVGKPKGWIRGGMLMTRECALWVVDWNCSEVARFMDYRCRKREAMMVTELKRYFGYRSGRRQWGSNGPSLRRAKEHV